MAEDDDFSSDKISESGDLQWALDVLNVWRHIGKPTGRRALKSSSAKELHEWASNPDNFEKFAAGMVPKATDIMAKHRKPEESPELVVTEKRAVAELRSLLASALADSLSE